MSADNLLFAFAGDPKVGAGVSALLEEGGYTATDLNNADVVFTYCPNTSVLEDLYYDTEGLLRGTKRRHLGRLEPFHGYLRQGAGCSGLREQSRCH